MNKLYLTWMRHFNKTVLLLDRDEILRFLIERKTVVFHTVTMYTVVIKSENIAQSVHHWKNNFFSETFY